MKQILIIGNIGRTAERVAMNDGTEKMRFTVAVNTNKNDTVWFGVLARMQEKLLPYLEKGRQVFVSGDLTARLYNGQIAFDVYADRIELCGGKPETEQTAPEQTEDNTF